MTDTDLASAPVAAVPTFDEPIIDVEEWRELPRPHLYVHGGFAGTDARFSFHLPPAEQYEGRFFQHFTPTPDSEDLAQTLTGQEDRIGFAFHAGASFVETNSGGVSGGPGSGVDPTVAGYRVAAAAAAFFREVARRVYGEHRPYGYAYGGSGGAYRTFGAAESTEGVWDGFVPYVAGSPMAAPNVFMVRMHAQRILRDCLDGIADAMEPGGSGDPYAALDAEQRDALREVTRMGFPLRSWFGHRTMGTQAFGLLAPAVVMSDPDYFERFWTEPGHLGADPAASVHRDRVRVTCAVTEVLRRHDGPELGPLADLLDGPRGGVDEAFKGAGPHADSVVALRLAEAPSGWVRGATLRVLTGDAAGTTASLRGLHGDLAVIDFPEVAAGLTRIAAGDAVAVDNSDFLAAQTYHRHQVPGPEYAVYDQYRDQNGAPRYPQRPFLLAPQFAAGAAGHVPTGRFAGRMILVESMLDREAYPWQADWYRARAAEHLGAELDDRFRVWYVDNALHGDVEWQEHPDHTVSYLGVLHEALRDLAAWVERGVPAPRSSRYAVVDGQVELPASAADRLGVQPVATLTVDGAERADVAPGAEVRVELVAEVPQHVGAIVRVLWDLDGDGVFETDETVTPAERIERAATVTFDTAGTRFVAVRVSSQHDGDAATPFGRIDNVARARIVVG